MGSSSIVAVVWSGLPLAAAGSLGNDRIGVHVLELLELDVSLEAARDAIV